MADDRLIEVMHELLAEVHSMRMDMNQRLDDHTNRLQSLEKQMANNNLAIGELRLSVMRLADTLEIVFHHEERLQKLEDAVFRKAS